MIESEFTRCAYTVTGVQTDSMAAVRTSYGINPQNGSLMVPCTKEVGQTNAVGHMGGVAISFKGGQSAAGGLGVDDGACQTMQSHMSALEPTVAVSFIPGNSAKTRSVGASVEANVTLASMNKPSVEIRTANGVKCLCPDQPQSHRVYSEDGAMPCLNAMEKRGGCDGAAVLQKNGVECLTPSADHPQTHRVYGTNGAYPSIMSNGGKAGQDQSAICVNEPFNIMTCDGGDHRRTDRPNGGMYVRKADAANCIASSGNGDTVVAVKTANTTANGDNVNLSGAAYTIDGANGQTVAVGIDPYNQDVCGDVAKTINSKASDCDHTGAVAIGISTKQQSLATAVEAAPTMGADDYKEPLAIGIGRDATFRSTAQFGQFKQDDVSGNLDCEHATSCGNGTPTLVAHTSLRGRPWDGDCNPTLTQANGCGIGASNQEMFAQNFNGLVMDETK